MTVKYCEAQTEQAADAAIAKIDSNCGFGEGESTTTWAEKRQTLQNTWVFIAPAQSGSHGFRYQDMMTGVAGVDVVDYNDDWFPQETGN